MNKNPYIWAEFITYLIRKLSRGKKKKVIVRIS